MRSSIHILLFLLASLLPVLSHGQAPVQAKVDTKQITIGDQVRYFIEAKEGKGKGKQLVWANIPDTFNSLEVVEKGAIDTLRSEQGVLYKQRLLITGFDSGMYQIPAFEFTEVSGSDTVSTTYTEPFDIYIQTVDVDTTKPFKEIKDIRAVELTWFDYLNTFFWIWRGAMLLTLIIMVIYTIVKKRRQPKGYTPPPPAETPHEKATRMLTELEGKQLWQQDEVKQYYVELTDILRSYIEERFGTTAMELTTDELLARMHSHRELAIHRELLEQALRTADMAKFAKAKPLPEEHVDAYSRVHQFVMITKPIDQPKDDNSKK